MASEIGYNPFASKTLKDPFSEYDKLREKCPVHKFDDFSHPLFTVTRYEDVVQLLTNIDMWSSHYGQMPRYSVQGCLFLSLIHISEPRDGLLSGMPSSA